MNEHLLLVIIFHVHVCLQVVGRGVGSLLDNMWALWGEKETSAVHPDHGL